MNTTISLSHLAATLSLAGWVHIGTAASLTHSVPFPVITVSNMNGNSVSHNSRWGSFKSVDPTLHVFVPTSQIGRKDGNGSYIQVGDTVAYSGWKDPKVKSGVVKKFTEKKITVRDDNHKTVSKRAQNCILLCKAAANVGPTTLKEIPIQ